MGENTAIEWCDHTFNPWTGCTKVSAACDHCYAEAWSKRSGHVEWGPHGARRRTKTWGNPVKWNKALEGTGRRARVFCASLSDVLDNHRSIQPEWRRDLCRLIEDTPNLDWLLLTKRPQNASKFVLNRWMEDGFPANVWLGTTVENQEEADRRIPHLLSVPARVHFLSCEPLLGPVVIPRAYLRGGDNGSWPMDINPTTGIDWIIAGGESGPKARPSHPGWFRSLRDQCADADVPFFFKQWGEWIGTRDLRNLPGGGQPGFGAYDHLPFDMERQAVRVGKKRAGRTLDGVVHDGFPQVTADA